MRWRVERPRVHYVMRLCSERRARRRPAAPAPAAPPTPLPRSGSPGFVASAHAATLAAAAAAALAAAALSPPLRIRRTHAAANAMGKPHKAPQKYDMQHQKHGKKDDDDGMPQQVPVPGAASSSAINTTAVDAPAPASPSSVSSSLVFFVILAIAGAFLYRRYYRDRRKHWKYSQVAAALPARLRRAHAHARTRASAHARARARTRARTRARAHAPARRARSSCRTSTCRPWARTTCDDDCRPSTTSPGNLACHRYNRLRTQN